MMPGTIPPANIHRMLVCVVAPTRMIGRLGGNRRPMLPTAVSRPIVNFCGYLPLSMRIVERMPPSARIVTPEAPVKVVKNAQTATAAMIMPPGIQPNRFLNVYTRRSPALLSDKKKPVIVKSGMAAMLDWVSSV